MSVTVYDGEDPELYIVGSPSPLLGQTCCRIVQVAFFVDGALKDEANEVLIETAGGWTQLCFDHGMVFWRPDRPEPDVSESEGSFALNEILSARGRRIQTISTDIGALETRVRLGLDGLDILLVADAKADSTRVVVQPEQSL